MKLSTRPENYMGDINLWNAAEAVCGCGWVGGECGCAFVLACGFVCFVLSFCIRPVLWRTHLSVCNVS